MSEKQSERERQREGASERAMCNLAPQLIGAVLRVKPGRPDTHILALYLSRTHTQTHTALLVHMHLMHYNTRARLGEHTRVSADTSPTRHLCVCVAPRVLCCF